MSVGVFTCQKLYMGGKASHLFIQELSDGSRIPLELMSNTHKNTSLPPPLAMPALPLVPSRCCNHSHSHKKSGVQTSVHGPSPCFAPCLEHTRPHASYSNDNWYTAKRARSEAWCITAQLVGSGAKSGCCFKRIVLKFPIASGPGVLRARHHQCARDGAPRPGY